ncbi:hypothetical protein SAMN05661044_04673 [Olivibacter domesticus]|uniref:Uncharacterized protein n=1 Tax=Olivibacter domesticus TaxID=407022 RepID=A0A1H7WTP5_OLID1|nr:hypothetical protein SAMN05661044_04673 [Olivibacter domesticus]
MYLLSRLMNGLFPPKKVERADATILEKKGFFNCIKSIENGSNKITTWALSVVGGTFIIILTSDYLKPEKFEFKLVYLLFIVGWILMGVSIYCAKEITGSTIASELYSDNLESLKEIFKRCNNLYSKQIRYFNLGLLMFGIWLVLFLIWWIFNGYDKL